MLSITKIALIGFLFIAFNSFSQVSKSNQVLIDSLNIIIQQSPKHDTTHIEALIFKGHFYYDSQLFDSCEALYTTAIGLLNSITSKELTKRHLGLKAHCYHSWGVLYNRSSSYAKAFEHFEKSLALCEELMDVRGSVFSLQQLMQLSALSPKDSLANMYLEKSRRIHPKIVDSFEMASNWETIGQYYKNNRRNIDSSIFWYQLAFRTFERLEKDEYIARAAQRLGNLYMTKDDPESATIYLYKALEIEEKSNNIRGIINSRLALANLFTLESDEAKALELLGPALELSRSYNFIDKEANILTQMGINSMHLNKLDESERYYRLSLDLVEKHGLGTSKMALIYGQLAVTVEKQGSIQEALECVLKGLELRPEIGQSQIYQNLHVGHLYFELGNFDLAKEYTLTSLEVCKKTGSKFELKEVFSQLRQIYVQQEDYEKALFYFTRSTTINDSLSDLEGHEILVKKEAEYQIAKKEQELALERKSSALLMQEQKAQRYLIIGLSLLLLTGLLAFLIFYQRKKLMALQANNKIMLQLHEIDGLKSRLHTAMMEGQHNNDKRSHINDYLDIALSQRELDVLDELIQGKTNKEISDSLCISINTVTTHLKRVYSKLEVGNRTQAVKKASELRA